MPHDIAVVGAGVSGLALATLLAREGHRVVLHERFTSPRPIGSGLMLQPTGLAALDRLGLRGQIEALGSRIERLTGETDRGTEIFNLAYGDLAPGLCAIGVHRAALHGVLWRAFEASGGALQLDTEITGMAESPDGRARLSNSHGERPESYDLIVDASGARSPFRQQICPVPARQFCYGAVWTVVPDLQIARSALAQRYVRADVMLGYLPVGQVEPGGPRHAALFWSLKPESHAAWVACFSGWRDGARRLWPELSPVLDQLDSPENFTLARYFHASPSRLSKGPLVMIGDAAHSTSPQLGQGANQGLIDAVVLAASLGGAPDIPTALRRYAHHRRRHVQFYQRASAVMTPFFQSDSRLAPWLRDASFRHFKRLPYLRREMVRTLAGLKTGPFSHRSPEALLDLAGSR